MTRSGARSRSRRRARCSCWRAVRRRRCGAFGSSRRSTPRDSGMLIRRTPIDGREGERSQEHQRAEPLHRHAADRPAAIPELRLMPGSSPRHRWSGLLVALVGRRGPLVWVGRVRALGAVGRAVRLLALGLRLRPQPRRHAAHQRAGDDLSAAADRHEAAAELHADVVAGHRRVDRDCVRWASCRAAVLELAPGPALAPRPRSPAGPSPSACWRDAGAGPSCSACREPVAPVVRIDVVRRRRRADRRAAALALARPGDTDRWSTAGVYREPGSW